MKVPCTPYKISRVTKELLLGKDENSSQREFNYVHFIRLLSIQVFWQRFSYQFYWYTYLTLHLQGRLIDRFQYYFFRWLTPFSNFSNFFSTHIINFFKFLLSPWRKYRIEIHSESIRTIPISVSEPMRTIPNQSGKTFCISFDEKRSKINPNESQTIRNQVFNLDQLKSIRSRIDPTKFPIRIYPNHSDLGFIRIDSD